MHNCMCGWLTYRFWPPIWTLSWRHKICNGMKTELLTWLFYGGVFGYSEKRIDHLFKAEKSNLILRLFSPWKVAQSLIKFCTIRYSFFSFLHIKKGTENERSRKEEKYTHENSRSEGRREGREEYLRIFLFADSEIGKPARNNSREEAVHHHPLACTRIVPILSFFIYFIYSFILFKGTLQNVGARVRGELINELSPRRRDKLSPGGAQQTPFIFFFFPLHQLNLFFEFCIPIEFRGTFLASQSRCTNIAPHVVTTFHRRIKISEFFYFPEGSWNNRYLTTTRLISTYPHKINLSATRQWETSAASKVSTIRSNK